MGENARKRDEKIAALRLGLDLGMVVVDTAEMYGDGETELLVGEAIAKRRDEVFLVSKVLPSHARRKTATGGVRGIPVMAYSPVEQGELLRHKAVKRIASRLDAMPAL